MALAQISEVRRLKLCERSAKLGRNLLKQLQGIHSLRCKVYARGVGLMAGLELRKSDGSPATEESMRATKAMLHCGFILLPEGEHGNVISFTPPLTITETQLCEAVNELGKLLIAEELR
jgi:4-aminobutyrate aminotransferase-like enzyme